MSQEEYILEMRNITKSFPGVKALDNFTLKIRPQTVHALIGENGAGKSTLMKILSGMYRPDQGEIYINGELAKITDQKAAERYGIAMIYQELNTVDYRSVAENLFLGNEPRNKMGLLDVKALYENADQLLKSLGLEFDPKMSMGSLSIAEKQMLEIAKAISKNGKIIVMDEPTSSLGNQEVDKLFEFIKMLKERGVSIIYISHRLEEFEVIADEVTVVRDGCHIGTFDYKDVTINEIISMMVGRDVDDVYPPHDDSYIGEVCFEVKDLVCKPVVKDISFSVKAGEILGVSGLVGAGRTEMARAIVGLDKPNSGKIFLNGEEITIRDIDDGINKGVVLLTEDRKKSGVFLIRSVRENLSIAKLRDFKKMHLLQPKREKKFVEQAIVDYGVKTPDMETPINSLSGGNQQKVLIARWLSVNPKVMILDEPTRGVSVGAKQDIYKLIKEMAKKGVAIIMISSELPEVLGMSDRVMVVADGTVRGFLEHHEATSESIMKFAVGG